MIWAISLSTMKLIPHSLITKQIIINILGFNNFKEVLRQSPRLQSALPLINYCLILYLNKFRRKPAISKFDKLFTPSHNSSQSIATDTGSVLFLINLFMASSFGFGSNSYNYIIIFHYCFYYALIFKKILACYTN
jgi:hypothetical protein